VVLSTTNVVYTKAALTATTNYINRQFPSPLGTLILDSLALFHTDITNLTPVTADLLPPVTNWPVLASFPASSAFYPVTTPEPHRFYAGIIATNVGVAWSPSPSPFVSGYRVYVGTRTRQYSRVFDVGPATSYRLPLFAGTNYIAATSYNVTGDESVFSTELVWQAPTGGPLPAFNLTIR